MVTLVIIEDEPQAIQRLETLIKEIAPTWIVVAKLDSVKQAVQWFKTHEAPSLAWMDIHLGDGLSFEIFDQVEINCPVIFTTAYDQYAIKAFKVNSIDYLLKPIDPTELRKAIEKFNKIDQHQNLPDRKKESERINRIENISKAMEMLFKKYKSRFVIKVGEHLRSVETAEILFFYSQEKATIAQTKDGRKHILDFTLEQLEGMTDPARFFRINRKYLVASDSIQDMIHHTNSRLRLVLKTSDDKDVIVARERVQEFKDWLDQ
jgi:DNA-binding LytR/AlgR family response regulator